MSLKVNPADSQNEIPVQQKPAHSRCARILTINLVALAILSLLAAAFFTLLTVVLSAPLFLIGTMASFSMASLITGLFFCRCCDVGPSWKVRRQFSRLPPDGAIQQAYSVKLACTQPS